MTVSIDSDKQTINFAPINKAVLATELAIASLLVLSETLYASCDNCSYGRYSSILEAIFACIEAARTGYSPEADSAESITASDPSVTAVATSETSALVGFGLVFIESSI